MHLRPLLQSDIPYLSVLAAASFQNDELFTRTSPRLSSYPDDFRDYMLWRLRLRSTAPGMHAFVCVSDASDSEWLPSAAASPEASTPFGQLGEEAGVNNGEVLLGYAMWTRHGPADSAIVRAWAEKNTDVYTTMNYKLREVEGRYTALFSLDRSTDPVTTREFRHYIGHEYDPFAPLRAKGQPGYWYLSILAASPIARRRGVGRLLLQWGIDQARREHAPVAVNSSDAGAVLYEAAGFKTLTWADWEGAGRAMVWDPEGAWTRTVEDGEKASWVERFAVSRRVQVKWKSEMEP